MNSPINFITPPSLSVHESFYTWLRWNKIMVSLIAGIIVVGSVYGIFVLINLRHTAKSLSSQVLQMQAKTETLASLKEHVTKINENLSILKTLHNQSPAIIRLLKNIAQIIPSDVKLNECILHEKKECTLKGYARSNTSLSNFIEKLRSCNCTTVRLVSLEQSMSEQRSVLAYTLSFIPKTNEDICHN
jgi:Tfp pilus assembly protein PilN